MLLLFESYDIKCIVAFYFNADQVGGRKRLELDHNINSKY